MKTLIHDLRYAGRTLLKSPGFTFVAIVTLALGIGANTAVFSMVRALLLRPVTFGALDRMIWVWSTDPQSGLKSLNVSVADFLDLESQARSFEGLAAWNSRNVTLGGSPSPQHLVATEATPRFFSLLSARPEFGRVFRADEGAPGRDGVAILSHGLWTRRFGSSRDIIGRSIEVNGRPREVIGVMPASFEFMRGTELFTPMAFTAEERRRRDVRPLAVLGLLRPRVSGAQADAELAGIASRLARQYPATNVGRGFRTQPLREALVGDVAPSFYVLLTFAAAMVLLVACANVANLLLARASARRREVAIRYAMGASRGRVMRQLLTESVLLALLGAGAGMLVAVWGVDFMVRSIPESLTRDIPGWAGFGVNGTVLVFAVAVGVVTGMVFGIAPALQTSSTHVHEALKEGQRTGGGSAHGMKACQTLVIAEVAVALILVTGAWLMVDGLRRQLGANPGFDRRGVLTMRVTLPELRYGEPARVAAYDRDALERLRAVPGVEAVALANRLPWSDWGGNRSTLPVEAAGRPATSPESRPKTEVRIVSAGYLQTLRIPLLSGRDFDDRDRDGAEPAVIVSRAMARRIAPTGNAAGQLIRIEHPRFGKVWRRVIGVCGDVTTTWWNPEPAPVCYLPCTQVPLASIQFALRASTDPAPLATAVRRHLSAVDPEQPIFEITTLEDRMTELCSPLRLTAAMMSFFGLLALLLATVGVYGVIAYSVSQRTHEIGVRMALGAPQRSVLALVMRQGMTLAATGLALGLPASWILSSVAASQLFGVVVADPKFLAVIAVGLATVALLASYFPARGASRVDPMRALRSE